MSSSNGNDASTWIQNGYSLSVLIAYLTFVFYNESTEFIVTNVGMVLRLTVAYLVFHFIWYFLDIHKRLGPWSCSEPASHFKFTVESVWIVALFKFGNIALEKLFGIATQAGFTATWEITDPNWRIESHSLGEDVFWGLLGFYAIDFLRYWGHRFGHCSFLYKTFPFSHAHHHNQIFVNPLTTAMSPLLHLASLATYTPPLLLSILGLKRASVIAWAICSFPNFTQHLGFDPFPWLTYMNHKYFLGALPWIPLYHSYHHNPFIHAGNFGNTTMLFDYIFGTVQPECVYHIENGHAMEKVLQFFEDEGKLDRRLGSSYYAGKGKNRPDLNDTFDSSVFKMYTL